MTLVVQPVLLPAAIQRSLPALPTVAAGPIEAGGLPLAVNLTVYQGDDFFLDLSVTDSGGNPVNMTGWVPSAQVRGAPGSAVVATFTCSVDQTNTNVVHLWLPHLQSMNLARRGVWDCQVDDAGVITTLVAGTVSAVMEVTT